MRHAKQKVNAIQELEGQNEALKKLGFCISKDQSNQAPSLVLDKTSEDIALDYLASILVEIFYTKSHAITNKKTGSSVLPGINKRTSRGRE
ncbi:hypothetical protein [Limnovirga soli]|uniref:Uncharacterized protein n=1 Tax=Limnovirga soli TaxID=2656915 RepID=A0A8J8F9N4_9BACT|nr:hypothetical protein [Limnovirga soli]NNV53876.1 hypothetical protein [Limnovirga soli]